MQQESAPHLLSTLPLEWQRDTKLWDQANAPTKGFIYLISSWQLSTRLLEDKEARRVKWKALAVLLKQTDNKYTDASTDLQPDNPMEFKNSQPCKQRLPCVKAAQWKEREASDKDLSVLISILKNIQIQLQFKTSRVMYSNLKQYWKRYKKTMNQYIN